MRTQKEAVARTHLPLQAGPYPTKRLERRYSFRLPVIVLGLDGGDHVFWEVTQTVNISWHGCMLHLQARPRGHLLLALQPVLRDSTSVKSAPHSLYEIVWTADTQGGCDVGARVAGQDNLLKLAFGEQK